MIASILALALTGILPAKSSHSAGDLDRLAALYKSYDLPVPPGTASLVDVGYLIHGPDENGRAIVWSGTETVQVYNPGKPLPLTALAANSMNVFSFGQRLPFSEEGSLALAIFEELRGHKAVAQVFFESARRDDWIPMREGWPGIRGSKSESPSLP